MGKNSLEELVAAAILLLIAVIIGLAVHYAISVVARRLREIWWRAGKKVALPLAILVAAIFLRVSLSHLVLLTGPFAYRMDIGSEVVGLAA